MSKFELYSNKSAIQFESHMQGLEEEIKKLPLDLRNFIKSLDSIVIEEGSLLCEITHIECF